MSIIIKYYIFLVTSILQIHNINSSETPSTFTTLPKPLLPPNESPSPSPHHMHHHPRRHRRHKQQPSLAKHGHHHLFAPAPSPSPANNSSLTPSRETSSNSCSVTGAENLTSHSLKSEITSSRSASVSQTMSRCPSVASTSTSRTLTQESCVNFSIPQRNAGHTLNSDEFESVDFALDPPLLPPPTPRLRKLWFNSQGTSNVSPEPGIPAKTLPPNPPLMPPPRLRKLWFESENTSNVLPELGIPAKSLPPNPPLLPTPRLRKMWLESEGTSNVSPEHGISVNPFTEWQKNKSGETSEIIF